MKVVTAKQMRELDQKTILSGIPGYVLMERAGKGAAQEIIDFSQTFNPHHVQHAIILAGKGNNAGDGYVIAKYLAENTTWNVSVYSPYPRESLQGDALLSAFHIPNSVRIICSDYLPKSIFQEGIIIIDCLLGTGIQGAVRDVYARIISEVNSHPFPVIAIDIPSGIHDDGSSENVAIQADLTITIGLPKYGLFLGKGRTCCGQLRLVDIGIVPEFIDQVSSSFEAIFRCDVRHMIHRLPQDIHKGTMGKILIIGGSRDFPGAPMLSGSGALRFGGGLVTVAYPQSIGSLLHPRENALIRYPLEDNGKGYHQKMSNDELSHLVNDKDIIAIGPGLSRQSSPIVQQILALDKPILLDADALSLANILSFLPRKAATILTPHPGEMRKLMQTIKAENLIHQDRITQAKEVACMLNVYLVLKGFFTVIATPKGEVFVNTSGTPGLATGGTGDVLTGMIAASFCQNHCCTEAILAAVFLHGKAAECSPYPLRTTIADDLPELLGKALKQVTPLG